jgi:hypothetical protein
MVLTARSALTNAGAVKRWMPFDCVVEYFYDGEWNEHAHGRGVENLAEHYNDAHSWYTRVRIINAETGMVIYG